MHRYAAELFADHLTLASVDASANVYAEFPDRVYNCSPAADRTRRAVKRPVFNLMATTLAKRKMGPPWLNLRL